VTFRTPGAGGRSSQRVALLAALAAALLLAPGAAVALPDSSSATLQLDVTWNVGNTITCTLPSGSPVGTTSGAPTVIPAGFYDLNMNDTAGIAGPVFDLQGPGVSLVENMFYGEVGSSTDTANFLPSSTYTWRDDANPSVVYTFTTTASVAGTPTGALSSNGSTTSGSSSGTSTTSQSVVGSSTRATVPYRGSLGGSVSSSGKLSLRFKGKPVTELTAGRYTITVSDASTRAGFTLQETNRSAITVTSVAFKGTHSTSVDLTAGQWFYYPSFVGKKTYFIVVS
jgi:hypothetical protein